VLLLANLTFGSDPPQRPTSSACIRCCGVFGCRPRTPCRRKNTHIDIGHRQFEDVLTVSRSVNL